MIAVRRLENELMHSNCYIVCDEAAKECVIIDPGSRKSLREIELIRKSGCQLAGILLTHEHSDHTWGVNALLDEFPDATVVASEQSAKALPEAGDMYFRLYYDDPDYHYEVRRVDRVLNEEAGQFKLSHFCIEYFPAPGHCPGATAYVIENHIFTGDSYMPSFKPYINKKNGDRALAKESEEKIKDLAAERKLTICPGHGEMAS